MEIRWKGAGVGIALAGVAALGSFYLGRAWAAGVPTSDPLVYSGVLTNASGQPSEHTQVEVSIWDDASDQNLNHRLCGPISGMSGLGGNLSIPLSQASCVTAVSQKADLFVELRVGGTTVLTPRTKIAAVPYALVAADSTHAASADSVEFGSGVAGSVTATTVWPGTVPASRVTSTGGALSVEQRVSALEASRVASQPKTEMLAATITSQPTPHALSVANGAPDGSWISTVSVSSGIFTINFTPTFSGMGCTVSTADTGAAFGNVVTTPATKTMQVKMFVTSGAAADVAFTVVCVGQLP